jgi:hypothetical protein
MSLEKIKPADTSTILSVYLSGTKALPTIETSISQSLPANSLPAQSSGSGHINNPFFTTYRELWRWVECLLRRAILAASRTCSLSGEQESALWPPTFRAKHRSTVAMLFIRALVLRSRLTRQPPPGLHTYFHTVYSDVPVTVSTVARRAIQDYRDILNASTRFPRAGERNDKVEELTDLCVAVWEAGGSTSGDAAWVLDVGTLQIHVARPLTFA